MDVEEGVIGAKGDSLGSEMDLEGEGRGVGDDSVVKGVLKKREMYRVKINDQTGNWVL